MLRSVLDIFIVFQKKLDLRMTKKKVFCYTNSKFLKESEDRIIKKNIYKFDQENPIIDVYLTEKN